MVGTLKLLALDIDGVVTDGRVTLTAAGEETKSLNFHDLDRITALMRSGMPVVFVTGESGEMAEMLAQRFGTKVITGAKDKLSAIEKIAAEQGVGLQDICYVGDSDRDAPALRAVGLGLAPANATPAARAAAHRVLMAVGGRGAVAEAVRLFEQMIAQETSFDQDFCRIIEDSIAAHQRLLAESLPVLNAVAHAFIRALRGGNKIMLFGNGGSAADAQHVAGELVGRFLKKANPGLQLR